MNRIEREPAGKCLYHRIFLPYHVGLEKIYTEVEIAKARESPQFECEYNLQYIVEQGNVFSHESIERAIELGLKTAEKHTLDYIRQDTYKVMGVDSSFGSSKFGIVICEFIQGNSKHHNDDDEGWTYPIIRVICADEVERPGFSTMIEKILKMKDNYIIEKIFVDSNSPEVVTALKRGLNE